MNFLALFFILTAHAEPTLYPHAEDIVAHSGPAQLIVTRFAGHEDFHSQKRLQWTAHDGLFFPANNRANTHIQVGFRECESILAHQQIFPLGKMVDMDVFPESEVANFLQISRQFKPGQVTVGQMFRWMARHDAEKLFGPSYHKRVLEEMSYQNEDWNQLPIVTASLWSIAGQVYDPKLGQSVRELLPWQRDPRRKALSEKFDQTRCKYVWEWGRAAQEIPREIAALYATNALSNYQELIAQGGKLEEACIMFHSFSEAHTRYYNSLFPNRFYPEGETNVHDMLFLVPLKEAMEKFKPSQTSGKVGTLVRLSNGLLDDYKAIEFLQRFDRIQFSLLDSRMTPELPLARRDLSVVAAYRRAFLFEQYGLNASPNLHKMQDYLMSLHMISPGWNSGQLKNLADTQFSGMNLINKNVIELSNLDELRAKFDFDYIYKVLIGGFLVQMRAVTQSTRDQSVLDQAVQMMHDQNVRFGISTFEKSLQLQLEGMHPDETVLMRYQGKGDPKDFPGQEWMGKGYANPLKTYIFTVNQIFDMIEQHPNAYHKAIDEFREYHWARSMMLSDPDVL